MNETGQIEERNRAKQTVKEAKQVSWKTFRKELEENCKTSNKRFWKKRKRMKG